MSRLQELDLIYYAHQDANSHARRLTPLGAEVQALLDVDEDVDVDERTDEDNDDDADGL